MIKVIAEIANAHQGDYKTAIKLANHAFLNGADAVKFQLYFADELLVQSHGRYNHFLKQSFSVKQWNEILQSKKKKENFL